MEGINTSQKVAGLEVYVVSLEQETPYLGPLAEQESANMQGYFVRAQNRTVYAKKNRSLVLRMWTQNGIEGWGETYGLVAPQATAAIILDLLKGFVVGRNPFEVERIYEDLYDLMRVRGYNGGFYHDALAAIDIALWDIVGKIVEQPLVALLGGLRHQEIPAYISGLPKATLEERCALAVHWQNAGFTDFKFALPVADQGAVKEMEALRNTLGDHARIACDMHWRQTREEALSLALGMEPFNPWFLEAPVVTEDVEGLAWIAQQTNCTIAVGEEWRTVYDAKMRIDKEGCQIIQPEMGHTGITQFKRMASYAHANHLAVIPHATIGAGIFLAASLQVSASLQNVRAHEFQHSIFRAFPHFLTGNMSCDSGFYRLPTGNGIGVEPTSAMKSKMTLL